MCKSKLCAQCATINISSSGQEDIISRLSVFVNERACVFVCDHIMPHAGGLVGSCRDEYNVDVKRKISGIYFGVGINYIARCWLQTQSGETVEVNRPKHRQEADI